MVPRADLVHDDAGVQHGGDFPDQLPEIHSPFGGEMERHLRAVKRPLRFDQLHRDPKQRDFVLADLVCFRLPPLPALPPLPVVRCGEAQEAAYRAGRVFGRCRPERRFDEPELRPVLAFRDHGSVGFECQGVRVAERDFSEGLEDHSGN